MGHCSRKPGAERRRFFELKRYFAPIVVNNHARRVVTNKLKRNHNATEFARRFACPLSDLCQFDILQSALPRGDRMKFGELTRREFITWLGGAGDHMAARHARAPAGPYSDEPLLFEARGFRLELPLSVISNCADLALSQALWTFMRQLFRLFQLVPLQRPALLAPAIISALSYPDLTGRIGNAPTLRDQYVNLLQLRGDFFRFVSLPRHV